MCSYKRKNNKRSTCEINIDILFINKLIGKTMIDYEGKNTAVTAPPLVGRPRGPLSVDVDLIIFAFNNFPLLRISDPNNSLLVQNRCLIIPC